MDQFQRNQSFISQARVAMRNVQFIKITEL